MHSYASGIEGNYIHQIEEHANEFWHNQVYMREIDIISYSKQDAVSKYLSGSSSQDEYKSFAFGDSIRDYPLLEHSDPSYKAKWKKTFKELSSLNPKIQLVYRNENTDDIVLPISDQLDSIFQ